MQEADMKFAALLTMMIVAPVMAMAGTLTPK
jgi:hypothetical protein